MRKFKEFIDELGNVHYKKMFLSIKDHPDKVQFKSHENITENKTAVGFKATLNRTERGISLNQGKKEIRPDSLKSSILNTSQKDDEFNDHELHAIQKYTNEGDHERVNSNLFHNRSHDNDDDAHTDRHLSSAISNRTMPRNMTLYSGMRSPEKLKSQKGHKLLQNPAYTSTSTSPEQARAFGSRKTHDGDKTEHTYHQYTQEKYDPKKHTNYEDADVGDMNMRQVIPKDRNDRKSGIFTGYSHVAKIHVPEGSHGLWTGHNSLNSKEDEVILHKNARIAFKEKPVVDHETKTVQWHGYLVHDGIKSTRHAKALGLK